jgi:hypothetical protein
MSLRTGVLRIATVIRGLGALAALFIFAMGVWVAVGAGWKQPEADGPWNDFAPSAQTQRNPFDQFDPPRASTQPKQVERAGTFNDLIPGEARPKQFRFADIEWVNLFYGLAAAVAFLGFAYVLAWVLEGFAPGN